jgi:hypothetical protein
MTNARIGRVLVASLHEAIGEVLPTRLDFYEHWLSAGGLREGGMGLAPATAVLSFLRQEGARYDTVMTRAGGCAADWTVDALPAVERRLVAALPGPLRARAALRIGRRLVATIYPHTRAVTRLRRGVATIEVRGSLFCDVRHPGASPLCGFYAAAFARILERFALSARAPVETCRAAGGAVCSLSVVVGLARLEGDAVAAA